MHPSAHDASVDAELLMGIVIGVLVSAGFVFATLATVLWNSCRTAGYTLVGGLLLSATGCYVYWLQREVRLRQHLRADVSPAALLLSDPTSAPAHSWGQLLALSSLLALFVRVYRDRPSADLDHAMQCYPLNALFCVLSGPTFLVGAAAFVRQRARPPCWLWGGSRE